MGKEAQARKIIQILEHDRNLALTVLKKTKQILHSKQGLIAKQKQIVALKQYSDKKRKAKFAQYSGLIKKAIHVAKNSPQLERKIKQLKKFYK